MKKTELKEGLYLEGDYAYISDAEIASCFVGFVTDVDIDAKKYSMIKSVSLDIDAKNPLKIHKSLIKQALMPEKGKACFYWLNWLNCKYETELYHNIEYRKDSIGPMYTVVKAFALTLNLTVDKLNILYTWSNDDEK